MHADDWNRVKQVLMDALDREPAERAAFIAATDLPDELRSEVHSLLELEEQAENMMNFSAAEFSRDMIGQGDWPDDDTESGRAVGVYTIIREIGRGGMGTVHLAKRNDGKFEQLVALKLLKKEMNTPAVRRHFEQEREILAALKHPNIALLLDAGTTEDNTPFLAMEYIDGLPITEYCNLNGLGVNERLKLFLKVCNAVDHAHRNLIVHRDLKPSNVLVTADGTPKLLDFGISKIISAEIADKDSATITRMGVMTPSYASPEQLRKEAVTTATDIYSLGVVLYELLSGHRPFESAEDDVREIYAAVLETAPVPPSAAVLQTTAEKSAPSRNGTETAADVSKRTLPRHIDISSASLRGDLDNIVLKALRKEPERRYASAEKFSDDISRHLSGMPVEARPNTFGYRAGKFIKRNTLAVASGALVFAAITAGTGAAVWQSQIAEAERAKAEKRFADVRSLANSYLFEVYPQIETLEGSLNARETIVKVALKYLDNLSGESSDDPELQRELAAAYEKIGDVQGAINTQSNADINAGLESYRKAERLRKEVFAAMPDDRDAKDELAQNQYIIARTLWWANDTAGAEDYFEKALALRRELHRDFPGEVMYQDRLVVLLNDYAGIPLFNAQSERARPLLTEARGLIMDLIQREPENDQFKKTYARLLRSLSNDKMIVGDHDGAIADLEASAAITRRLIEASPDDYRLRRTMWLIDYRICEVYINKGDKDNVVSACEKAIEFNAEVHKKEPGEASAANDLAVSYFNAARANRIAGSHRKAIEYARRAIGVMSGLVKASPDTNDYLRAVAIYQTEIGENMLQLGEPFGAFESLTSARETLEKVSAADPKTATYLYDLTKAYRLLAAAHHETGNKALAGEFIGKALEGIQKLESEHALKDSDATLIAEIKAEREKYSK